MTHEDVVLILKKLSFESDPLLKFTKSIVLHDKALAMRFDLPTLDPKKALFLESSIKEAFARLPVNLRLDIKTQEVKPKEDLPAKPVTRNIAPTIKHFVMVSSGKGGVGKTTTSVNIAYALSKLGKSVGILDADIYGPNVPRMMGISGECEVVGDKLKPLGKDGIKCMSLGVLYESGQSLVWRGPMVMRAITQMLSDVLWGELDILVIDMPPGTGDAQLTLAQVVPLSAGITVTTPQLVSLDDAARSLDMLKKLDIPIAGIVENMFHDDDGAVDRLASEYGTKVFAKVPFDREIMRACDDGCILDSKISEIYVKLAQELIVFLDNVEKNRLADNSKIQPTNKPD